MLAPVAEVVDSRADSLSADYGGVSAHGGGVSQQQNQCGECSRLRLRLPRAIPGLICSLHTRVAV